jgi:hypothetical protein
MPPCPFLAITIALFRKGPTFVEKEGRTFNAISGRSMQMFPAIGELSGFCFTKRSQT